MSAKSRPPKRQKLTPSTYSTSSITCRNVVKNLFARDLGILTPYTFISTFNQNRLSDLKLSKSRSVRSFAHSITWLSLDNVDSRYLLVSKSDGNFVGIDMFQEKSDDCSELKLIFNSAGRKNLHSHSISCIQWYPIDSGMFFTSGMDQKFKVWDTNSLAVVDEYALNHKIYNHNISTLMSNSAKTLIALALDNGQVRLIDLNSGSFSHTLKAHSHGYCVCVQWSPYDPNILASGGSDGRIGLWDIRSSRACLMYLDLERSTSSISASNLNKSPTAHSSSVISLTYTPDSNHIISLGKDNQLRLWDSYTGRNTLVNYGRIPLAPSTATTETCIQLGCTQDDCAFVPSGANLLVYGLMDGECRKTLKGHFEPLTCCLYNSALNEVYSGARDRNMLIWDSNKENEQITNGRGNSVYSMLSATGRRQVDNWSDEES